MNQITRSDNILSLYGEIAFKNIGKIVERQISLSDMLRLISQIFGKYRHDFFIKTPNIARSDKRISFQKFCKSSFGFGIAVISSVQRRLQREYRDRKNCQKRDKMSYPPACEQVDETSVDPIDKV